MSEEKEKKVTKKVLKKKTYEAGKKVKKEFVDVEVSLEAKGNGEKTSKPKAPKKASSTGLHNDGK